MKRSVAKSKMHESNALIAKYVNGFPPEMAAVIEKLRQVVTTSMPNTQEIIHHDALGYTPTGSPWDRIIYIWPTSRHVTLGFFFGAHLKDPTRLLVGEGVRMRHVKVRTVAEADNPELRKLVDAAAEAAPKALASMHKKWRK